MMRGNLKKWMALMLSTTMLAACMTGCGSEEKEAASKNEPAKEEAAVENTEVAEEASGYQTTYGSKQFDDVTIKVELWDRSNAPEGSTITDNKWVDYVNQEMGKVGIKVEFVPVPRSDEMSKMQTMVASQTAPDITITYSYATAEDYFKQGGIWNLAPFIDGEDQAKNIKEYIGKDVLDIARTPDNELYGIVARRATTAACNMYLRKDWLDKLGLKMPATQEEFVAVLRAFKTQDPNGNGQADEIPTGGRAEARWMDYLFSMYGIAMWEGFPQWDIYDGELTYAAVTPNMRDALEFISGLYQEGLLDAETLMNDKAGWDGKVNSDQVGVFFQWAEQSYMYATNIYNATGTKADWSILPVISADGYEGFYTKKPTMGAQYGVKNMDDAERIEAAMKVLDAYGNKELRDTLDLGPEGMTSSRGEDGTLKKLPDDKTTQENMVVKPSDCMANVDSVIHLLELTGTEEDKWAVDKAIQNVKDVQQYGRLIAGDGIPSSIYDGYDDIENRTLYVEYASKIIAGEWPIEKFDEFVEKWYASGGEEVTNAARDWYAAKNK